LGTGPLLPAPALAVVAASDSVPGSLPAAGDASAAPVAADVPAAARLLGAERKAARGPAAPLAAGEAGAVSAAVRLPGTVPRTSADRVAAAGIPTTAAASKVPPSRPAPGRKIRPRHPPSRSIPAAPRRTLPGAAGGPSRPGEALCGLEPATPTAMCRPPARPTRLRLVRRGQAVPSGSVRPIPARQERHRKAPRRNSQTLHSPARQEQVRVSPPAPPTAPAIPQAAAR